MGERPSRRSERETVNVGNRSKLAVARVPIQRGHYRALPNMARLYPRWGENLVRLLTGRGKYPYRCAIRTPLGVVAPMLYSSQDISMVTKIFCRQDHAGGSDLSAAVDLGSNIGISGLYFLTRNRTSRCYLFEPHPRNVQRLHGNLDAFQGRFALDACAIGEQAGTVELGGAETIHVRCREINEVLASVLELEPVIDILKIDMEGSEVGLVQRIAPDILDRIGRIYFVHDEAVAPHGDRFTHSFECQTNRLINRRGVRDSSASVQAPRRAPSPPGDAPASALEEVRRRFPRVAITHEWLTIPGGSEKVVLALLELFPEAELFTSVYDPAPWPAAISARPVHTSFLDRVPRARQIYPRLLPFMNAAFESFDLHEFDLVLSSNHACAKNVLTGPGTLHVCYCYTPMRYAWEPEFLRQEAIGPLARLLLPPLVSRLRRNDLAASTRPDMFVAISQHVAGRIAKYYRRDAKVVHPPVDVASLLEQPRTPEDYYLVLGRVVPYKRAEVAVAACERLGRTIKVVGEGRGLDAVRAQAGPHTQLLGWVDDTTRAQLLAGARALLFPGEEDFGMVPVEAQAAGVPVVAYGRGGVRDTVIDGETGLLYEEPTVEALSDAILAFEAMSFDGARLREQARRFAPEVFRAGMLDVLHEAAREPAAA